MLSNIILLQTPFDMPCWWWWLCSLGAFLLGWLLHWLLFARGKQLIIDQLTRERDGVKTQFMDLERDFASLKYQFDEITKDYNGLKTSLQRCEADKSILKFKLDQALEGGGEGNDKGGALGLVGGGGAAGGTDYVALLGANNLQIIEGIGPKIESLLQGEGISTWAGLAATPVDRLQTILSGGGASYRLAKPDSWPRQAQLAAEGKWAELIEYQKFLDAGIEDKGDLESPSKVEKLVAKALGFSNNPEDLKVVEGIGPKIEGLLKDAGINNWTDLAAASEDRLQAVLAAAGDRYRLADPSSWAKQAELAAAGKWNELAEYQEFLSGGKAPDQA